MNAWTIRRIPLHIARKIKIILVLDRMLSSVDSMFRVCPHCDFEWHDKDGDSCPACRPEIKDESESLRGSEGYDGGAFGTGTRSSRLRLWYQAIGLVALVYLLYAIFGGG